MFKAIIKEQSLKEFITPLKDITNSVEIVFTEDLMSCDSIDLAQVSMLSVCSNIEDIEGDTPTSIKLDITRLSQIVGSGDVLLTYENGQLYAHSGRAKYNIPILVDAAVKSRPAPNLIHTLSMDIQAGIFYDGVKAVSNVYTDKDSAALLIIKYEDDEFILTDGSERECVVTYEDDDFIINHFTGESVSVKISMEYALKYASRLKIVDMLTISTRTEYPVKLIGETSNVSMSYIIAPRIDVT
ncbi:MAG: hypothetical protein WCS74_01390 [Dehalococcoidales bacterium]|jgi:hypothetical protein